MTDIIGIDFGKKYCTVVKSTDKDGKITIKSIAQVPINVVSEEAKRNIAKSISHKFDCEVRY